MKECRSVVVGTMSTAQNPLRSANPEARATLSSTCALALLFRVDMWVSPRPCVSGSLLPPSPSVYTKYLPFLKHDMHRRWRSFFWPHIVQSWKCTMFFKRFGSALLRIFFTRGVTWRSFPHTQTVRQPRHTFLRTLSLLYYHSTSIARMYTCADRKFQRQRTLDLGAASQSASNSESMVLAAGGAAIAAFCSSAGANSGVCVCGASSARAR